LPDEVSRYLILSTVCDPGSQNQSQTGIFVAVANNTLDGSKLSLLFSLDSFHINLAGNNQYYITQLTP